MAPVAKPSKEKPDLEKTRALISQRVNWGKLFWKPLHDRMDYGYVMYLLLDPIQQLKPVGFRRHVSNDPRTAIDAGVSILTRNDPFWRIDMPYGMNQPEREQVGKIERALAGIVDDLDDMFTRRFELPFWKQAAFFALMRGAIWGKFIVTEDAIRMGRNTPLLGEFRDPRFVYPNIDGIGLESVAVEKQTSVNELFNQYPEQMTAEAVRRGISLGSVDPNSPAVKVEFWSNARNGVPGLMGVLAYYNTSTQPGLIVSEANPITAASEGSFWLIEPMYHGYSEDQLPVVGVAVNGVPIKQKPQFGTQVVNAMNVRAQRFGLTMPTWHDPSGWVAEWGRGLLTSVEELVPQYNELIATMLQYLGINTFPTWVFNTQTGELPDFEDGMNAKIPLRIGEDVRRMDPRPVNADAYRLLEIIREEKERGTLNAILQGNAAGLAAQSGVVLQQHVNASLNTIEPYGTGTANFGSQFGSHMLEQLRVADTKPLSLVARGNRTYFRVEFDPRVDLEERKYKPIPIFRPSVPEDLLLKAQVARLLLDPRMPIMSVVTVLDRIFQLEDPEGEGRRMLEDIANRDPVILLERIAGILEDEGEPEMAERIRQKEFQARFEESAKMLEIEAQVAAIRQQMMGVPTGAEGTDLGAQSGSPTATGAGQPRPGQGGAPSPGGDMSALGSIGGGAV